MLLLPHEELAALVTLAVALSLSVISVPDFRAAVVPSGALALTCAVIVALDVCSDPNN